MECYIVDSFTNQAYKGNPAGVCILEEEIKEAQMQAIATELNYSETAFVKHRSNNSYSIRFFSPKMEIPLCGHATLASAKVLFTYFNKAQIKFITINDVILSVLKKEHQIQMEFPLYDLVNIPPPSDEIISALGISDFNYVGYNKETDIVFIEMDDHKSLEKLSPQFSLLESLPFKHMGISISAQATDAKYDFYSRFFWPWSGTNEDPVTGGTHTFLTKYWSKKLGKKKMKSFQCSARTGFMEVEIIDASSFFIRGEAVIILSGKLNL